MSGGLPRVRLLGAESTGKTTLAATLACTFETVWNPEYGRPYTELGRPVARPWTSDEFTHIARLQCWYEDALEAQATRVLFCDTDAFTTALFHEVYLGRPTNAFDELVERSYALTFVCGLDVPWRHDGVREFESQRRWMHARYVTHATESGAPWRLLEGDEDHRLDIASAAVASLLEETSARR